MNEGFFWLGAIIIFVIAEAVTYQLISVWFAAGAIGGLIAYLLGFNFEIQEVVFGVLSLLALISLRPIATRFLKIKDYKSNIDGLIGKEVYITKIGDTEDSVGEGTINGLVWTIRSEDGTSLKKGEKATITKIEGVKLLVK